jgi:hypothetical protein
MMGFSLYVSAPVKIPAKNKENAMRTARGKRGIVHIIDLQSVLAPITMDIFQTSRIDRHQDIFVFHRAQ